MANQILWKSSFVVRFGGNTSSSVIGSLYQYLHHYPPCPSFSLYHLSRLSSTSSCFLKAYPILTSAATTRNCIWLQQQEHHHHQRRSLFCCFNYSSISACGATGVDVLGKGYLELTDEELMRQCEFDTFKSSGPGGQHRNKRESAVRLKHLPTGIIAQAVEERSQHRNRASALTRLRTLIALKGTLWISMLIHHLESFFKYFRQSHPSEDQTVVPKLDPIIQNLSWYVCYQCTRECKLYWISFLQLRDLSQKLQSFLG